MDILALAILAIVLIDAFLPSKPAEPEYRWQPEGFSPLDADHE